MNKTAIYTLRNTYVGADLSNHKTLAAAIEAKEKHARGTRRANGGRAYVTYEILKNGEELCEQEMEEYLARR